MIFPSYSGTGDIDRNNLLATMQSPAFGGSSTGQSILGSLITGGLGILNTYIQSKVNPSGPPPVGQVPIYSGSMGTVLPSGFQAGAIIPAAEGAAAAITESGLFAALRALGARIVGRTAYVAAEVLAAMPSWMKTAAAQLGITLAVDAAMHALTGGSSGHKRRRMNPLNIRAARRSIARIKSVRKTLHSIEKQLPMRKAAHHGCAPARSKKKCS